MIDSALLRTEKEIYTARLLKKDPSLDIDGLCDQDVQIRSLKVEVEELRKKKMIWR